MHQYNIRYLHAKDRTKWITLWQAYLDFYQTQLPKEVTENTLKQLLSNDKSRGCLVACDEEDGPIGFLTYIVQFTTWSTNPECYLHDLYVQPSHRKIGAARCMVNKLKDYCQEEQFSKLYWITKPDNATARIFYDSIAQGEPWIIYEIR